jgi:hypothetical protein
MDASYFFAVKAFVYFLFFGLTFVVEFVCLWKLSKYLKFKKADYLTALKVSLVSTAIGIVFQAIDELLSASIDPNIAYLVMQFIGLIVYLALIKHFYAESWKKTFTIVLIIFVIELAAVFLLSFVIDLFLGQLGTTETTTY